MRKVVVLQEYVPGYRVPFFELLHKRAAERGVDIQVAHGEPQGNQAQRGDDSALSFGTRLRQREFRVGRRRLVFRSTRAARRGADLVVIEQARRNVDAYALLLPKFLRSPIVLWGHGKDYTRQASSFDRLIVAALTRRADWFLAYTEGGKRAVVSAGLDAARVSVLQNSIDSATLRADIAASRGGLDSFSTEHDLSQHTAIFLGALDESKRIDFLLRAADRAHSDLESFRLLVVGDGPLRTLVEEWVTSRPWASYLGPLEGKPKALALAASQVIAIPGRIGLVAVDSFASGVPIITTSWPWHAPEFEYLEDGRNAVVAQDDVGGYAAALVATLQDSVLLSSLSVACLEASKTYTVEAMAENYLDGLIQALESVDRREEGS